MRHRLAPAYVYLFFRMIDDLETSAAQHRLDTCAIRNPPVGGIIRVALLDEIHRRVAGLVEDVALPERIIRLRRLDFTAPALHGLENQLVTHDMLVNQIKRKKRMPEMIKNAHE